MAPMQSPMPAAMAGTGSGRPPAPVAAAFSMPSMMPTEPAIIACTSPGLRRGGGSRVGADERGPVMYHQADLNGPLGLVMGAEGRGLRRLTSERCDVLVQLPMEGIVESLNVSVALGVMAFEAVRQRSV